MPLRPNRNPSSLACTFCRQRHLKCDALIPACSRCEASGLKCHYVASKRGLRSKISETDQSTSPNTAGLLNEGYPSTSPFYIPPLTPTVSPDFNVSYHTITQSNDKLLDWLIPEDFLFSLDETSHQLADLTNVNEEAEATVATQSCTVPVPHGIAFHPMIKLYYQNFHASHPFIIPHKALGKPNLAQSLPPYLFFMMEYIGAHFHPDPSAKNRYQKIAYMGLNEDSQFTGFRVQAMLLAAIVDHADGNEEQAGYSLQIAVEMANQLGMQDTSFAKQNSYDNAMFEESWRRTFWELSIVVQLYKSFSGRRNCEIKLPEMQDKKYLEMELPCDEAIYFLADAIPKSQTLFHFQNSWRNLSNDSEETFSSFSYRIEAARLWNMVQSVNARNNALLHVNEIEIETLEVHLASLMIRLIENPSGSCYSSLAVDQMRKQAQMMTSLAIIYLHHPQSRLYFDPIQTAPSCIQNGSPHSPADSDLEEFNYEELDLHSLKTLRAADTLLSITTTNVFTSGCLDTIKWDTPFIICGLAMSIMIHGVAMYHSDHNHYLHIKEDFKDGVFFTSRIELGMRTLDMLSDVWPLANIVKRQLSTNLVRR